MLLLWWQGSRARWLGSGLGLSALLLGIWWGWRLEPFHRVGMASQDQLIFSLQGTGDFWGGVLGHARDQGRVYFLLNKIVDLWLAARPEGWRIHAFNLCVYALSAPCLALAVFRGWPERLAYVWLFASVSWAGFHHLPPAAYPSVNHLPFLLWPLAAWLVRRAERSGSHGSWPLLLGFALLALLGFTQYEPVTGLSLCVLGWLVYDTPPSPLRRRLALALAAAAASYGALYLGWGALHPTSYNGLTHGDLSPWQVLRVAVAYTVGGLPFSQAYAASTPLRFGDSQVGEAFLHSVPQAWQASGLAAPLLSGLGLLGLWGLLRHGSVAGSLHLSPPRLSLRYVSLALLMVLASNGPLALSSKYQDWAPGWDATYVTSQLALYPLLLPGGLLLAAAYRGPRWRGVPLLFVPLALAVCVLSLPVQAHNRSVTALQRANLARWEGVTALAAYAQHLEEPILVAPDLFYSVASGEEDWARYWGRYVQQRFGGWLAFQAAPPERGSFALIRLHRFEDGRLRALTVQTRRSLAIVARRQNAPIAVVAQGGVGVPLDWQHEAEALGRSGYSSVTLHAPAELLGPRRVIEPVWVWPPTGLALQR